uniref:Intraflagellar transport protein 46 homolog n=1 Tax=Parascaris univalens TaxID=6257 RepID=A0A914ZIB5_PARUN
MDGTSKSKPDEDGIRSLGEPFSDSSDENNDDERHQQIVGLEEEKGIFGHPEVVVPPAFDSDDEAPMRGANPFRKTRTDKPVDIAQSSSLAANTNNAFGETSILLGKTSEVENLIPVSNLSDNPADFECKFATSGRITATSDGISAGEDHIGKYENDGYRGIDYPKGPPPAYSSGEHTPEENPLIGEDDEDITASLQPNRFQGNYGERTQSVMNVVGMAAAVGAHAVMGSSGKSVKEVFTSSDDDSDLSASEHRKNQQQVGKSEATTTAQLGSEEKQLLQFIDAYTPEKITIEPILKPFLLDYIPAVGDIDAFIKIPRPDEVEDNLGLTVLDEPAAKQSDPTILGIQLRNEAKDIIVSDAPVKKLDRADKNAREIEQWISNIKELHRLKPPDTVHYSKPMPDIELLMQEWPPEIEELLKTEGLPSGSLDVSLEQYVDICLSLLDIPVHKSRVQSLHVLFTLFNEFRNSQHFRNLAENNIMNNALKEKKDRTTDRLELV